MRLLLTIFTLCLIALLLQTQPPIADTLTPETIAQSATPSPGVVYVNPQHVANQSSIMQFNVSIQVSRMSGFNAWDVFIQTKQSVIVPMNLTVNGDLFEANYTNSKPLVFTECINGHLIIGITCQTPYGPGYAEIAAGFVGQPPAGPLDGLLFNMTFRVVDSTGYSAIQLYKATFSNGTPTPVDRTLSDGSYGTPQPDFTATASAQSLRVYKGSSTSTYVNITGFNSFQGPVVFHVYGDLNFTIQNPVLDIQLNGKNSTQLIFRAANSTQATLYAETVNATSGSLWHSIALSVIVQDLPYFSLSFEPSFKLNIAAGDSGNTTLVLTSWNHFTGNVSLAVQVPANLGVGYSLASTSLFLSSDQVAATNLTIITPLVGLAFVYQINVTAYQIPAGSAANSTRTLTIVPPPPSLAISVEPTGIELWAGESMNVSITVWSVNYFVGNAYVSAVMSGGRASFDHYLEWIYLPNSTRASYTPSANYTMTIKVGSRTVSGNYVILLTAYSIANGPQAAVTRQTTILLTVYNPTLFHTSSTPIAILGLSPSTYYMEIAVLAVPFAILGVLALRKWRDDQDDEYLKD